MVAAQILDVFSLNYLPFVTKEKLPQSRHIINRTLRTCGYQSESSYSKHVPTHKLTQVEEGDSRRRGWNHVFGHSRKLWIWDFSAAFKHVFLSRSSSEVHNCCPLTSSGTTFAPSQPMSHGEEDTSWALVWWPKLWKTSLLTVIRLLLKWLSKGINRRIVEL